MKLGALLLRVVIVAALIAGAAQWWLVQRAHEVALRVAARLVPYGGLRYEKLWPDLWGSGRVWGLSFEPGGIAALNFSTPPGYRVEARELRIHEIALTDDGRLDRVRGTLIDLEMPVIERHARLSDAPDPADVPLPTLYDLGYTRLRMDVDFSVRYVRDPDVAMVQLNLSGKGFGRAFLDAELEGTPDIFNRAPDQILLRRADLEFADGGYLQSFKDLAAARSHSSRAAWEQAMIARLDRLTARGKWHWDEDSAQAMRRAIRESGYFRASIDPPSDVVLRNIRLYPVGEWPRLLGFKFFSEGAYDHPSPGRPLPWPTAP